MPASAKRPLARALALATVAALAPTAAQAGAGASSFSASIDRAAVAPDQPFLYRVTLTTSDGQPEGFKPPDFRGLRVVGGPFTQTGMSMQVGSGGTRVENSVTWSYQLTVPQGTKGQVAIGAAHVRAGGQDLSSNAVQVRIGAPAAAPPPAQRPQRGPNLFPRGMFGDDEPEEQEPVASSATGAFLRAVADKKKAFVGEQVTVTWYLYVAQMPSNFQPITQPKSDGFWMEEIPSTNPPGRLAFTDQVEGGQHYQAAVVLQRALFPLAPGKLNVTPMEAEIRERRFLRAPDPPAPAEVRAARDRGRRAPQGRAACGFPGWKRRALHARRRGRSRRGAGGRRGDADHDRARDRGRAQRGPASAADVAGLEGVRAEDERRHGTGGDRAGQQDDGVADPPERPGQTTMPALTFVSFDPAAKRYVDTKSQPIELLVSGEPGGTVIGPPTAAGRTPAAGVENVIAAEIRPIRVRAIPSRSVGASFVRGTGFKVTLVTPPLAFVAFAFAGRLRERLSRDERRTGRRRLRSIARRRLHAAAAHRDAGRAAAFYVEIERVLRDALSEKLRVPVGGLRLDELADLLGTRGLPADDVTRLRAVLEACDEARFSPGGEPAGKPAQDAMLERAAALIDTIEKAPLAAGRPA